MRTPPDWITVTREDRETVGYLDPVTEYYDIVQPRTLLGHRAGEPTGIEDGEQRLRERGISELAEVWVLDAKSPAPLHSLAILEVSPHGIVVADALATKALAGPEQLTVPWPDIEERLSRE
jgi:hypothetical protein